MVKKTVNQDAPTVYHLFYADEKGNPRRTSRSSSFAAPPRTRGRGHGPQDRLAGRIGEALDFWEERLRAAGHESERDGDRLRFADPEGLEHELVVATVDDQPLIADHGGAGGVRAPGVRLRARTAPTPSAAPLAGRPRLRPHRRRLRGAGRPARRHLALRRAARGARIEGAGTVHHIAWASSMDEHLDWRERAIAGGAHPTP